MSSPDVRCPGIFARLLDDASTFPPGDLPLEAAVPAHLAHRQSRHGQLVGPFVVAAGALPELAAVVGVLRPGSLEVAVTAPLPALAAALTQAARAPAVQVVALEVTVPEGMGVAEALDTLGRAMEGGRPWGAHDDPGVFVELPRDERREPLLGGLAGTAYVAKLRTGGLVAELYPGADELASAIVSAVRAGVPFKATAGLHHAVRNTDPATGFEQHGFLNVLVATGAARAGARTREVARLLEERDPARVVPAVQELDWSVRQWFRSFGTCSIAGPVRELAALGLIPRLLVEPAEVLA